MKITIPEGVDLREAVNLDTMFCFSIYSTQHAINRFYRPLLERLGLTYPQLLVMFVMWETDGVTMKTLGQRLGLDSSTLTPLVKKLESAGLVTRSRNREDERLLDIVPTAKGKALHQKGCETAAMLALNSGKEVAALETLRQDVLRVRKALEDASGSETP